MDKVAGKGPSQQGKAGTESAGALVWLEAGSPKGVGREVEMGDTRTGTGRRAHSLAGAAAR